MRILIELRKVELLTTYEHNLIDVEKHLAEAKAEVRVYKEVVDIVKHIPAEKESH